MIWTENELARNLSDFEGNQETLNQILLSSCENTSESVLQTILELCNMTSIFLYLPLIFKLGANFYKIRRLTDAVLQFCILTETDPSTNDNNMFCLQNT